MSAASPRRKTSGYIGRFYAAAARAIPGGGPASRAAHRRLLALAAPMIVANLTVPLLGAVDTAVAGRLPGPHYLGGVALGALFFNVVYWSLGFLRMGTTGLAAQAAGRRDWAELRLVVGRALLVAAALGLVLAALREPLVALAVRLFDGSAAVEAVGAGYMRLRLLAAPFALGNFVLLGWAVAVERARLALAVQLGIAAANAALALFFVLGLGWGVEGIAAATALAETAGCLAGLTVLSRLLPKAEIDRRRLLDRGALLRLFAVNRDIFLRTLSLVAVVAWFGNEGASLGDAALAANAVLLQFHTLAAYGLDGFAHACEALVGAAVGARDAPAFRRAVRAAFVWALATASLFSAAYALAGSAVVPLLSADPAVREGAVALLAWIVLLPLVSAPGFLLDGVFIGATRTAELRNSMAAALLAFFAADAVLVPAWGAQGLWASYTIFMATRGLALAAMLPRIPRALTASALSSRI